MKAQEVFDQSDAAVTTKYYCELMKRGLMGQVAFGLFRAIKRSSRAKGYRRRRHTQNAYDAKSEALEYLDRACDSWVPGDKWGWKRDNATPGFSWVLYVDLAGGQVSFHARNPASGHRYHGEWDQKRESQPRIMAFCDYVMTFPVAGIFSSSLMPFGKHVGRKFKDVPENYWSWIAEKGILENWPALKEWIGGNQGACSSQ